MHPIVKKHPRLKALYELDTKIGAQILGSTGPDRKKLIRLRRRVRDEIRSIDPYEEIRAKMNETTEETPEDE